MNCPEEDCGHELVLIQKGKERGKHKCFGCNYEQGKGVKKGKIKVIRI